MRNNIDWINPQFQIMNMIERKQREIWVFERHGNDMKKINYLKRDIEELQNCKFNFTLIDFPLAYKIQSEMSIWSLQLPKMIESFKVTIPHFIKGIYQVPIDLTPKTLLI